MAIKKYHFNYDDLQASAAFTIDTEIFTAAVAKETLEFFDWEYDKENDPINEVMKKYAMKAIKIATAEGYNAYGVSEAFKELEGYCRIDNSMGIYLDFVEGYEFNEHLLAIEILVQ